MKKIVLFSSFFTLVFVYSSAAEKSNKVYFSINSKNRKIDIPIQLNDSITAKMTFDTGAGAGTFYLDSTFCKSHPSILLDKIPSKVGQSGSAWSTTRIPISGYETVPKTKIGIADLKYNSMGIYDFKRYFNSTESDGLFGIPQNDTTHVWELNFEHNYLEIHPVEDFKMPDNCFVFPILMDEINHYPFNIQLPIKIKCVNGDTLTINRKFMIDTGMSWDIALMYNAKELPFFNKKEDAAWIGYLDSYFRYYIVDAMLFDNYQIDSLRIYTFNYPNSVRCNYLIGQNFLKRFNVFFDMKNRQIGLQPIETFQRVTNPNYRQFHLSTFVNSKGKTFVREVGNYKGNYYKTAGFQNGDEIIKLNGKLFKNVTYEDKLELFKKDTLIYDIIRKGKPMKIAVKVDKNEKQGD